MLAHQDAQHLWPNIVAQLALASVATAFRPAAASGAAGVILGQARVLAVYLLAVLGGGIAFTLVEVRPGYSQDFDFSDARKMTKNYPHPAIFLQRRSKMVFPRLRCAASGSRLMLGRYHATYWTNLLGHPSLCCLGGRKRSGCGAGGSLGRRLRSLWDVPGGRCRGPHPVGVREVQPRPRRQR